LERKLSKKGNGLKNAPTCPCLKIQCDSVRFARTGAGASGGVGVGRGLWISRVREKRRNKVA